jgi:hypothetical protein
MCHTNRLATKKILANFLQRPCCSKWGMHMPNEQISNVYLWSKCESKVICFVCHAEIFQIMALHVVLLVSSESSGWVGVHQLGLRLFGAMGWKLLIIEPFSQWKLNKIDIENFIYVNPFVDQPVLHFEWDLLGVTVWDSAIVLAKYMERCWPERWWGRGALS